MKISERNIPLLKYLKWKSSLFEKPKFNRDSDFLFVTPYDQQQQYTETCDAVFKIARGWGGIAKKYSAVQIDLPSKTFMEALERSKKSFSAEMIYEFSKDRRFTGVIIGHTRETALLYDFQNSMELFGINPANDEIGLRHKSQVPENSFCQFIVLGAKCDTLQTYVDTKKDILFVTKAPGLWKSLTSSMDYLFFRLQIIVLYEMFKKYAQIDTKVVNRKSRNKRVDNELCINETEFDLNYVDCTWFTTIVRTEGFNVRGHFRLQPKKDAFGEWTRELIYINDFVKHGYTRKAKMLSQPDCEPQMELQ